MDTPPSLPAGKQPLHRAYHNWVFLKAVELEDGAELVHSTRQSWVAALSIAALCLGFGAAAAYFTGNWRACLPVPGLIAMAFVAGAAWTAARESKAGPLLRLSHRRATVELPRAQRVEKPGAVVLKLQTYRTLDQNTAELNLEITGSGERLPITRILGDGRPLRPACLAMARHGLAFAEEDLRGRRP